MNESDLIQAERLISDIVLDSSHPANDRRHPQHEACEQALQELVLEVERGRAKLEAQRRFCWLGD